MAFKLNPLTGELDLVNGASDPFLGSVKLEYFQKAMAAYDRIASVTYLDSGLRTVRISTISYSSTLYPGADVTASVSYLDVGEMNQRIDKIEWTGGIFGASILRKSYQYSLSGLSQSESGFTFELI